MIKKAKKDKDQPQILRYLENHEEKCVCSVPSPTKKQHRARKAAGDGTNLTTAKKMQPTAEDATVSDQAAKYTSILEQPTKETAAREQREEEF
jgi:hypothetical protein